MLKYPNAVRSTARRNTAWILDNTTLFHRMPTLRVHILKVALLYGNFTVKFPLQHTQY